MTASEFSFLALGLILGAISGAAVVELIRARPPVPRDGITVAHDAIRRRATMMPSSWPARSRPAVARRIAGSSTALPLRAGRNVERTFGSMAGVRTFSPDRPSRRPWPAPSRSTRPVGCAGPGPDHGTQAAIDRVGEGAGLRTPSGRSGRSRSLGRDPCGRSQVESMPIARRIQTAIGVMERPTPSLEPRMNSNDMESALRSEAGQVQQPVESWWSERVRRVVSRHEPRYRRRRHGTVRRGAPDRGRTLRVGGPGQVGAARCRTSPSAPTTRTRRPPSPRRGGRIRARSTRRRKPPRASSARRSPRPGRRTSTKRRRATG